MFSSVFGSSSGRDKQITSLKSRCPSVVEKSKNNVYELALSQTYTLRVVLPANFPKEPPHLQILPPTLRSRFIDPIGKVYPGSSEILKSWNPQSPLADAVAEVAQLLQSEISGNQSPLQSNRSGGYPRMGSNSNTIPSAYISGTTMPVNYAPHSHSNPSVNGHTQNYSPTPVKSSPPVPRVPSSFAELENLSEQRMQQLLDNPQALEDFFHEMSCVRMLNAAKEETRNKNQQRAQKNLEKELCIQQGQQKLADVTQQLAQLRSQYEQLSTQQAELMKQYTPSVIKEKLQNAVDDAEERSESIINDYNNGDLSINQFIDQYYNERKVYHLRRAKMECL